MFSEKDLSSPWTLNIETNPTQNKITTSIQLHNATSHFSMISEIQKSVIIFFSV